MLSPMGHRGSAGKLALVAAIAIGVLALAAGGAVAFSRSHQAVGTIPGQVPTAEPDVPVYCSDARQACIAGVDLLTDIEAPLIAQQYRCAPGSSPRKIECLKDEGPGKPIYKLEVLAVGRGVASIEATVTLVTPGARPPVDQARPLVTWMAQLPFKRAPARAAQARQWIIGHLPTRTTSRPLYQTINHYSYLCRGVGVDTGGFQSWTIDCGLTANYVP